jgi:hypothetical protein
LPVQPGLDKTYVPSELLPLQQATGMVHSSGHASDELWKFRTIIFPVTREKRF